MGPTSPISPKSKQVGPTANPKANENIVLGSLSMMVLPRARSSRPIVSKNTPHNKIIL